MRAAGSILSVSEPHIGSVAIRRGFGSTLIGQSITRELGGTFEQAGVSPRLPLSLIVIGEGVVFELFGACISHASPPG
jgi:hypothetical protein